MAKFKPKNLVLQLIKNILIQAFLLLPLVLFARDNQIEFREVTTEIDGYTIHYRSVGNGPALLMLHGFTLTGQQWASFAEEFSESYTVIIPDLPGHGGSSPINGTFSFAKSAQLMHGLLDEVGEAKIYGIGHSAGGMILLHMVEQNPDRLEALILVDAPHYFGQEAREMTRNDKWDSLDAAVQDFYLNLHSGGQKQAERIFKQYNGLADTNEKLTAETLATLSTRILLIWGDQDPAFPLEIPLEMHKSLPNATLWVIPQQGHTPLWPDLGGNIRAAQNFCEIAKEFLAQKEVNQVPWF